MNTEFTLLARANGKLVPVEIRDGVAVAPDGTESFYMSYSEDGNRYYRALGKNIGPALAIVRKMEIARELRLRHGIYVHVGSAAVESISGPHGRKSE